MGNDSTELKNRYESFAKTLDYNTTACDYNLRELEIDTACEYLYDGSKVLDVGCGLGYACIQYSIRFKAQCYGIDYAANMIQGAVELLNKNKPPLKGTVTFTEASVLELPYENGSFDVVTSSRCLMALLNWDLQKQAIKEIHRILKPGGIFVMMEGTFEGLERLNKARQKFGLEAIAADGKDRLCTLKFNEDILLNFIKPFYACERIKRFGMYYFITRILQPLLVFPDKPSYEHKINKIAKDIASVYPDFEGLGHLVSFIFVKRH